MASKKRGGLSKREAAAAKVGGTLNYKTGKISVPVKTAPKPTSKPSKSIAPLVGAGPLQTGQTRVGSEVYGAGPLLPGQTRVLDSYSGGGSSGSTRSKASSGTPVKTNSPSGSKPSASSSTNYNTATLKPTKVRGGALSTLVDYGTETAAMSPLGLLGRKALSTFGIDLTKLLGIDAALAKDTGLSSYVDDNGQVLGVEDQVALGDFYRQNDPSADANTFVNNQRTLASGDFKSFRPTGDGRKPRQIVASGNPTPSPSQDRTYTPEPQFQSYPDLTPVSQGRPGTRRQFLGNGLLSNGLASNGKLETGIEGLSMGAPMSEEDNLLNQLLGISTARASDLPQQVSFGDSSPVDLQQAFASGGLTLDQGYSMPQFSQQNVNPTIQNPTGQYEQPRTSGGQNPGGSQSGGVAQQYSQGATGGNPVLDYQKQAMKGLSAQEKAQKKALKELLKSIENQYKTKQTEGLSELEKSKQQDLLKLSGLFSFANQDPNSEQRIQYEQRANQDYADQQTKFLAQLAAAQAQEVSGAKQGYQNQMADIAQQRNTAQEKIAQLIYQMQQDQRARSGGRTAPSQKSAAYYSPDGSYTFNEVDPVSGLKIFYDPQTNQPFING